MGLVEKILGPVTSRLDDIERILRSKASSVKPYKHLGQMPGYAEESDRDTELFLPNEILHISANTTTNSLLFDRYTVPAGEEIRVFSGRVIGSGAASDYGIWVIGKPGETPLFADYLLKSPAPPDCLTHYRNTAIGAYESYGARGIYADEGAKFWGGQNGSNWMIAALLINRRNK